MKKYVNPIVMVLIGVLIYVLAEGVDQRTVVKKKNVKIDQSKLTYDEAEQYRRSLPDREPDNNNLVALRQTCCHTDYREDKKDGMETCWQKNWGLKCIMFSHHILRSEIAIWIYIYFLWEM